MPDGKDYTMIKRVLILMLLSLPLLADPLGDFYGRYAAARVQAAAGDAAFPTNGLVSYWAMRTNGTTTVYDEYGSNDGTTVNTPTFSAANGVRDLGVGLNGTDQNINLGSWFSLREFDVG